MPIEHKTTYLPVSYIEQETGKLVFKRSELPLEPDVAMFFETNAAQNHLNEVQAEGYELISVAPVLKAVAFNSTAHGPSPYGFAYPLTAGFALFWKRFVSEQV